MNRPYPYALCINDFCVAPAPTRLRATTRAQRSRSASVYATRVGRPLVPDEPWTHAQSSIGTASIPNGYASHRSRLPTVGRWGRSASVTSAPESMPAARSRSPCSPPSTARSRSTRPRSRCVWSAARSSTEIDSTGSKIITASSPHHRWPSRTLSRILTDPIADPHGPHRDPHGSRRSSRGLRGRAATGPRDRGPRRIARVRRSRRSMLAGAPAPAIHRRACAVMAASVPASIE